MLEHYCAILGRVPMMVITQAVALFGVPTLLVTDKGRMFESTEFVTWINDLGCDLHYITPEMHHANGQVERYIRTILNMVRIEANHKGTSWSTVLWKLQLVINITKQKTTQASALNLLIGTESTTPVIRSLIRDVAAQESRPNREALRELSRSRAHQLLRENQAHQDEIVNRHRRPPREFNLGDLVFVIKYSQSTGKLDPGMRGPYKVVKILPSGRYELKLLAGSYGKTTQAAAQFMVPWRGEWCPETCAAFFEYNETNDLEADAGGQITMDRPAQENEVPAPARGTDVGPSTSGETAGPSMPLLDDD